MNGRIMAVICVLLGVSLACGVLQVSVEGTPSALDLMAAAGTVSVLQTQNAELATKAAGPTEAAATPEPASATPLAEFPATPTPTPVPATRITFLSGATAAVVSAPIGPGQTQTYVLDIGEIQPMIVNVRSTGSDVTVSIQAEDGATLLASSERRSAWRGSLPMTGDYYLTVHGGASPENFTLVVSVPQALHFAPGTDSISLQGSTVAGYDVSYAVYALQGQKMDVDIERGSTKGSLAVFGFQDGTQYLRSVEGQKSFHLRLPASQDYIISVVPFQGLVVDYILTITVQ